MHDALRAAAIVCGLSALCAGASAQTPDGARAPEEDPLARFAVYAGLETARPDYSPYETLIDSLTAENGGRRMVAFAYLEDATDWLDNYLQYFSGVPVSQLTRERQLAFWLNLRNLLIIRAGAGEALGRDMADERGTPGAPGPVWTAKRIVVEGVSLSIDDIERGVLLRHFGEDPNLIYGLYQGSAGGPDFPGAPYQGETVRAMLREAAETALADGDGLRVRRQGVEAPAIVGWYFQEAFGGDAEVLRAHLLETARGRAARQLEEGRDIIFAEMNYRVDEFRPRQRIRPASGGIGSGAGPSGS